jgi:hypothetical protein
MLSSALLAASIRALGLLARSLSGGEAGIQANADFGTGVITRVNPSPIRRLLRKYRPYARSSSPPEADAEDLVQDAAPRGLRGLQPASRPAAGRS